MMTAFMVTVRPYRTERYIDSLWIDKDRAIERVDALKMEWKRLGFCVDTTSWWAFWSEIPIEDGVLAAKPEAEQTA